MDAKRDVSTTSDDDLDRAIAGAKPMKKGKQPQADDTEPETVPVLPPTFGALRPEAMKRMARRAAKKEQPVPLPWEAFSKVMGGGLWPGMYVLVGGTGTGRSQLSMQLAYHAARANVPAAYVGLELDELQLVARVNALAAYEEKKPVHWSHTYLGQVAAPEIKKGWESWPLHLQVAPPYGWAAEDLTALGQAMRGAYPQKTSGDRPFLLVVDFLQLVDGRDPITDRTLDLRERIGRAAYAARGVARDLDAAVVLVSSTARDNYGFDATKADDDESFGRVHPRKFIGMGKESGEIEFAADTVLVLGQTGPADPLVNDRPMALALAKNRAVAMGAPGPYVNLIFDGTVFRPAPPPKPSKFTRDAPTGRASKLKGDVHDSI